MQGLLTNVAHLPDHLRYHLFSLPALVKNGHNFEGCPMGVVVRLKSERSIVFPQSGTLYSLYGYRVNRSCRENTCAVLIPGQVPDRFAINPTAITGRLDTPTKYYSARSRSSKGLPSRESCRSAEGAP